MTVGIVGSGRSAGPWRLACRVRVPGDRDAPAAGRRRRARSPTAPAPSDEGLPFEPRLDRVIGPDGLPELLAESDIVVLAAPLTPETEDMIDEADARAR